MGAVLSGLSIIQVAVVVTDLEAYVARQNAMLGNGPWRVYELGSDNIQHYEMRGAAASGRTLLALNDTRPQIEILQPLGGSTPHQEWLDEQGEGLHHVGYVVDSVPEGVAAFAAEGIEVIASGRGFGPDVSGSFAYLDTLATLGMIVELIEPPTSLGEPLRRLG